MGNTPIDRYKTATDKIPAVNISYREGYRDKEGKSTVQLIVYLQTKRIVFNSGVKVRPEHWDATNHRVKKSHKEATDLNLIINTSKAKLNNQLSWCKLFKLMAIEFVSSCFVCSKP